jgi:hypothetical protein
MLPAFPEDSASFGRLLEEPGRVETPTNSAFCRPRTDLTRIVCCATSFNERGVEEAIK